MRWTWDQVKNRANQRKHGISFETAQLIFDDPLALSRPDLATQEERWQTLGRIGSHLTILVIHTWPELDRARNEEVGRIISARKATAHERKAYEDGNF